MMSKESGELHTRKVLNVGGNNKNIPIPDQYSGWQHILLDIDPKGSPDIVCDARGLLNLNAGEYDSIYCSHNIEHYYRHDVDKVLAGFLHLLKEDGFAYIRVPDLDAVMRVVVQDDKDIDDFLYQSPAGPITARDVIYGYGVEIERSGNDFYAHKTGFTPKSLEKIFCNCGFNYVFLRAGNLEIRALAFKNEPTEYVKMLFDLHGKSLASG